jgi:hypothetical protein
MENKSFNNWDAIHEAEYGSCYYCLKVSPSNEIKEWSDERDGGKTALCPHCRIDSLLPGQFDKQTLQDLNKMYFSLTEDVIITINALIKDKIDPDRVTTIVKNTINNGVNFSDSSILNILNDPVYVKAIFDGGLDPNTTIRGKPIIDSFIERDQWSFVYLCLQQTSFKLSKDTWGKIYDRSIIVTKCCALANGLLRSS